MFVELSFTLISDHTGGGGGGGYPLYGLYRYVQPQRVWVFSRFGFFFVNGETEN